MCLIYNKVACDSGIQNAAQELHSVYQVMPDPILKEKYEEKNKGGGAEKKTKEQRNNILTQLNCQYFQLIILKAVALFPEQVMKIYLQKPVYLNLNSIVKPQTPGFPPTIASECLFTERFRYTRQLHRHVRAVIRMTKGSVFQDLVFR